MHSLLSFYVLILSHITSIYQMVNTRNQHASASNENNDAGNPLPPPTLEQVMLMQAYMLQTMQQMMANMHQGHQQAPQPHPRDKLGMF
jgi:hypothetical protein